MNSFPYTANDRLYGTPLALDLSSNPGATPPRSAHGNSTLGKLWLDTSVAPPQLRVCAVVQTQPTYVAGDWFSLGSVTGGGSPALTYMPLAGDSTKAGSLVVNTNLTVGGTGYFGGDVTIHGGGAAALSVDNGGISTQIITLTGGGDAVLSVPTGGITVVAAILTGGGAAVLSVPNGSITVGGAVINGALSVTTTASITGATNVGSTLTVGGVANLNGGGNALVVPNGNALINGSLNIGTTLGVAGDVTINGGGTALSVPNGNITTNGTLTVGQTGYFGGDVTIHGGGAQALFVDNGGIRTVTSVQADGGGLAINATGGDIRAAGVFQGQYLHGGADGNAGTLRMYNAANLMTFRWDGINVFYRVDGASALTEGRIPFATGFQGIGAQSDGGSPTGMSIDFQASVGVGYAVHVDQISDARLKDNIRPTEIDALAALIQIPVRAFEWNKLGREHMPYVKDAPIGLVAQELLEVMSYAVGITEQRVGSDLPRDLHRVIHEHMTPYFVRAIQQLEARVKILEGA